MGATVQTPVFFCTALYRTFFYRIWPDRVAGFDGSLRVSVDDGFDLIPEQRKTAEDESPEHDRGREANAKNGEEEEDDVSGGVHG